jgi:hypothetical protein
MEHSGHGPGAGQVAGTGGLSDCDVDADAAPVQDSQESRQGRPSRVVEDSAPRAGGEGCEGSELGSARGAGVADEVTGGPSRRHLPLPARHIAQPGGDAEELPDDEQCLAGLVGHQPAEVSEAGCRVT